MSVSEENAAKQQRAISAAVGKFDKTDSELDKTIAERDNLLGFQKSVEEAGSYSFSQSIPDLKIDDPVKARLSELEAQRSGQMKQLGDLRYETSKGVVREIERKYGPSLKIRGQYKVDALPNAASDVLKELNDLKMKNR